MKIDLNGLALFRFAILALTGILFSCKTAPDETANRVAKVYDDVLTRDELISKMPPGLTGDDSARVAEQMVTNWIHNKAVLNFAEQNLSEAQKNFSHQLDEYRNSLITYAYERELINQKLDTNVSDQKIEAYYNAHIQNFKLKTYIVKLRFVKFGDGAPKQRKLEKWFRSDDPEDFDHLYEYCHKYAENYYFGEDTWLYLQDVLKEVPIEQKDWDSFLKNTTFYTFNTERYTYLVRFFDYKLKGDTSPRPLERDRIKDLILNRRKVELINKMREDVVEESYANKKIQVYP